MPFLLFAVAGILAPSFGLWNHYALTCKAPSHAMRHSATLNDE